jgi:hypothetical protein
MLWNAQISRLKKFFLIMLFSGGLFVIMAGILRCYFILSSSRTGGIAAAHWGTREAFVAFVIGNLPMIYGGVRIWIRSFKDSKTYSRMRERTRDWPGARRVSKLLSLVGRTRHGTSASSSRTEKSRRSGRSADKDFMMLGGSGNGTQMSGSSEGTRVQSPVPWAHKRSDSRIDTLAKRSDTPRAEMDPEFGIQVTRGIKVDVESVKSRESDPDTLVTASGHSRSDSEANLGPFMLESPTERTRHGTIAELPSNQDRYSTLNVPNYPEEMQHAQLSSDGKNDTKWISD